MTRRIAFAILTIVWLVLLTAGVSTYYLAQKLLTDDLDDMVLGRIASLPEVEPSVAPSSLTTDQNDRFVIQYPNKTLAATSTLNDMAVGRPVIIDRWFSSLADGTRIRTLVVQAYARREKTNDPLVPVRIVYSASAKRVTDLLNSLLKSLTAFGLFAAVATAAVARSVAQATTRPLREAAEVIGKIDEKTLDRRIDVEKLPVELVPMSHRLNELLARLETAFLQRRQFLADASHELRTPVAGLVTTLEVALRKKRDADDYARILATCLTDARLLNQLVVALLEQVRSQRFGMELEIAPTRLATLIGDCVRQSRVAAGVKNIRVDVDLPAPLLDSPDNTAYFLSDDNKLRSIITNLLSNAIEYTPHGGLVRLAAVLSPAPDAFAEKAPNGRALPQPIRDAIPEGIATSASLLVLTIEDDGPGIPPTHLPNLFEPFYRADGARSDPENHLGLGLAIVRACARALGGDCRVQSPRPARPDASPAPGTIFTVELPAIEIAQNPPNSPPTAAAPALRSRPKNFAPEHA